MAKRPLRVVRWWLAFAYQCSRQGPLSATAPWIGTLAGSLLISGNAGNVGLALAGAGIAALGCLPVFAAGHWAIIGDREEDRRDARERKVLVLAQRYLGRASEVTLLPRAKRVAELRKVSAEAPRLLCEDVFEGKPGVRAVVYGVSASGGLEVVGQAGRADRARDFDATSPRWSKVRDFLAGPARHVFEPDHPRATYSTYIAAPIRSTSVVYGMLTIDSPNATDLDENDGFVMEVLASALSLYFAEAIRGMHR